MEIFIDTASISEIKKYSKIGIIDGVTTNPALVAKEGRDFSIKEFIGIKQGTIFFEHDPIGSNSFVVAGKL